jgi:hypothetical protein
MPQKITLDQPCNYRICVQGRLNGKWADYFEGMQIENGSDTGGYQITYLSGPLADQAALQGVLQKLYNLGFPLILAEKIDEADGNQPAQ